MKKFEPTVHNRDLLANVFDASFNAMMKAKGSSYSIAAAYYMDVKQVIRAAEEGAKKARRIMMDQAREK